MCPEKDIHSLYIDGELPADYTAEYEAHVNNCQECQKELARLRSLRAVFQADSKSMDMTQAQLDSSFDRLMSRMSYAKVTGSSSDSGSSFVKKFHIPQAVKSSWKYVLTGAAAAAVVAVVIPAKNSKAASSQTQFQPVARSEIQYPAAQDVVYDGTLSRASFAPCFGSSDSSSQAQAVNVSNSSMTLPVNQSVQGNIPGAVPHGLQGNLVPGGMPPVPMMGPVPPRPSMMSDEESQRFVSTMTSYDVFNPILAKENQEEKSKGFTISLSSPLGNFSLEIGNSK